MTNPKRCPFCDWPISGHSAEQSRSCLSKLAGIQEIRDGVTKFLIEEQKQKRGVFSEGGAA